jgi:AraC-like DNA-binding protein
MISARRDGRGHWPRGKRRGTQARNYVRALRALGLSWRDIAGQVGIDPRQLRRYLAGEDYASPARIRSLRRICVKFAACD